MRDLRGFIVELKRRNVPRAAILYAGAIWALAQGIAQLGPPLGAPDWILPWFVVAGTIGFPLWIAFAWFYEFTAQGWQRESGQAPGHSAARAINRKLDYWIIGVLSLAVVLLLTNQFVLRRDATSIAARGDAKAAADGIAAKLAKIPEKSIAVLPLANVGDNKDGQFFSDGLSADFITALSQFGSLKVINRASAFQFRNSKDSVAAIGAMLGVAHLLQGSVQHLGDQVRISVELVDTRDGSTLWSQHYDRPFHDLFKLQDEITRSVAAELKAKLLLPKGAVVQSDRPPSGNMDAYMAFLRASSRHGGNESELRDGVKAAHEAIRIDPDYAAAYAELSMIWSILGEEFLQGAEMHEAYAKSLAAANTAIALDPNLAAAHRARGLVLLRSRLDFAGSRKEMERARQLEPNQPEAVELAANDPGKPGYWLRRAHQFATEGKLDDAIKAQRTGIAMRPEWWPAYMELEFIEVRRGDAKAALNVTPHLPEGIWRDYGIALALQVGDDRPSADAALQKLIKLGNGYAAFQIAEVYAVRKDPANMFKWLGHAWNIRDPGLMQLWKDPFLKPWHDDPRFVAFAQKIGLPDPDQKTQDADARHVAPASASTAG